MLWNIPVWPPNVIYSSDGIYDQVRDKLFPLNPTGHILAAQVNAHKTLMEMAQTLAEAYNLEFDMAADDVRLFFLDLNRQLLVNFKNALPRWPNLRLLIAELLPIELDPAWAMKALKRHLHDRSAIWHRRTIDLDRPLNSFGETIWLIVTQVRVLWLVFFFGLFLAVILLSLHPMSNVILSLITIAASMHVAVSLMLSLAVHEMGHALAWRCVSGKAQALVAANDFSARVVCPSQSAGKETFLALGGSGMNVLLCCVFTVIAFLFRQCLLLQVIFWLFAAIQGFVGIISLFGSDGRRLQHALSNLKVGGLLPDKQQD